MITAACYALCCGLKKSEPFTRSMRDAKIELFFLRNLLQITLIGVSIILLSDMVLTSYDEGSVIMDVVILVGVALSYFLLSRRLYKASVIIITSVPLLTMFYHAVAFPDNSVPLTVIIVVGFMYSILLRGKVMWFMHVFTLLGLAIIFTIQSFDPGAYMKANSNEVIALAITYFILYVLLVLSTGTLKSRYDRINRELKKVNHQLAEKTHEIEAQNDQLIKSHDMVNALNQSLEQTVEERTNRIVLQNEQLLKYAYVNAHHVRGPIARLLGLLQLSRIDNTVDLPFIFEKIEHEANEIDTIIKRINVELEKNIEPLSNSPDSGSANSRSAN
jgi:signal transduction histidine kinase